jgi:hypothetical protein
MEFLQVCIRDDLSSTRPPLVEVARWLDDTAFGHVVLLAIEPSPEVVANLAVMGLQLRRSDDTNRSYVPYVVCCTRRMVQDGSCQVPPLPRAPPAELPPPHRRRHYYER